MNTLTSRQVEIIESAGKILTNLGISKLTIKNIAKEMNFAESAVYRHFSSKEEIVIAMLDYLAITMDERYLSLLNTGSDPVAQLEIIFLSQIDYFVQHPFFVGAIFPDGLMDESEGINTAILNLMDVRRKHLLPVLEKCRKTKRVRGDLSSEELAHILMGSFRLLVLQWRLSNFSFDLSQKGKVLLSNVIKLITI